MATNATRYSRDEYQKKLNDLNDKWGGDAKGIFDQNTKREAELYRRGTERAYNDPTVEVKHDWSGTYKNPKFTQGEKDELDELRKQQREIRDALNDLDDYLSNLKKQEAAIRKVGREFSNPELLDLDEIEEYNKLKKKESSLKSRIKGLQSEIEYVTKKNTAEIEELSEELQALVTQLTNMIEDNRIAGNSKVVI